MKIGFLLALLTVTALLFIPTLVPACTLKVAQATGGAGALVVLPVEIRSQGRATGVQFDIAFDTTALSMEMIAGGAFSSGRQNPRYSQVGPQTSRVIVIDPAGSQLTDGVLLNLLIRPTASATAGTYPVSITSAICVGADASSLETITESGSVTISEDGNSKPVTAGVLLNAASLLAGPISRGEIVTLLGSSLNSGVPRLTFGTADAVILYRDSNQINALVPDTLAATGQTNVQLLLDNTLISSFDVALSAAAPGVFTRNMRGDGYANALNGDGSLNMPSAPAERGSTVTAWITGALLPEAGTLTVTVGGERATIVDATPDPDVPAVVQIRFIVPAATRQGPTVDLSVSVGAAASQAAVWLSIQ